MSRSESAFLFIRVRCRSAPLKTAPVQYLSPGSERCEGGFCARHLPRRNMTQRLLRRLLGAVVSWIKASVVRGPIDGDPIRLVDAPSVGRGARRKGRCQLDPTSLLTADHSDFVGGLGEILILAEE